MSLFRALIVIYYTIVALISLTYIYRIVFKGKTKAEVQKEFAAGDKALILFVVAALLLPADVYFFELKTVPEGDYTIPATCSFCDTIDNVTLDVWYNQTDYGKKISIESIEPDTIFLDDFDYDKPFDPGETITAYRTVKDRWESWNEAGEIVLPEMTPELVGLTVSDRINNDPKNAMYYALMELILLIDIWIAWPQKQDSTVSAPSPSRISDPEVHYCKYCGAPIDSDDTFCSKCGKKLY